MQLIFIDWVQINELIKSAFFNPELSNFVWYLASELFVILAYYYFKFVQGIVSFRTKSFEADILSWEC